MTQQAFLIFLLCPLMVMPLGWTECENSFKRKINLLIRNHKKADSYDQVGYSEYEWLGIVLKSTPLMRFPFAKGS